MFTEEVDETTLELLQHTAARLMMLYRKPH